MLKYHKGSLLDTTDKFIIHGVNCQGVMGSGVAKALRDRWPDVYDDYIKFIEYKKKNRYWAEFRTSDLLGQINVSHFFESQFRFIINAFTQDKYGKDGQRYVNYDAINSCMVEANHLLVQFNETSISMPKIGAGLGGGDWDFISKIIKEEFNEDITVNIWEL